MLAVLCPGQGAQTPGFLTPWLDVPGLREHLETLSSYVEFDLVATGTRPDADVVDTAVAQPLLVAAGLATGRVLGPFPAETVLLGHSVGEITAAGFAGAYDAGGALTFARERGSAMAAAAARQASGMTAVLGGDAEDVAAAAESTGCWIANFNAPGQLVVGGSREAVERFAAAAPAGARLRPLQVAGAFHTPLMQSARDTIAALADDLAPGALRQPVVSNADGAVITAATDLIERLVAQITAPVRFDQCLDTLRALGVTATIELAPGGVLTAIVRRALPDIDAVALRTPDDLEDARRIVSRHTDAGDVISVGWRLLVAPVSGTLQRSEAADGSAVYPAEALASVTQRTGSVVIESPVPGELVEWLAEDGDPVQQGQPVARIAPATS